MQILPLEKLLKFERSVRDKFWNRKGGTENAQMKHAAEFLYAPVCPNACSFVCTRSFIFHGDSLRVQRSIPPIAPRLTAGTTRGPRQPKAGAHGGPPSLAQDRLEVFRANEGLEAHLPLANWTLVKGILAPPLLPPGTATEGGGAPGRSEAGVWGLRRDSAGWGAKWSQFVLFEGVGFATGFFLRSSHRPGAFSTPRGDLGVGCMLYYTVVLQPLALKAPGQGSRLQSSSKQSCVPMPARLMACQITIDDHKAPFLGPGCCFCQWVLGKPRSLSPMFFLHFNFDAVHPKKQPACGLSIPEPATAS